mgnify:CR=1 FL=1
MFTKTSKLKAIFKEAYKEHSLDIGLSQDNVYIIRGHIFMMKCPAEFIENEVLAELVKLTGGLPGKGEAISYVANDEPQMTDMEFLDEDLYGQWDEGKQIVEPTRMLLRTEDDIQVIYQSASGNEKIMVPARLHNCVDTARGMDEIRKATKVTKLNRLIVISNEMQFRFNQHAIKWKQEKEILDACSSINLNWQTFDENLL